MGVFRNRDVLMHDYTPSKLPHREKELEELRKYFEPVFRENFSLKVHVNGKIGTRTQDIELGLLGLSEAASFFRLKFLCEVVNFLILLSRLEAWVSRRLSC